MPAYNCARYIQETINCLCNQTHQNLEIIIVNDGSTDATAAILKDVADKRVTVINAANGGASMARNIAFKQAKGRYIIFFDADDFVHRDFISSQLQRINNQETEVVLSAWGRFYKDDFDTFCREEMPYNELSFPDWINYYWYNCNPMTNPGRALIPKKLVDEAGLWDERLSLNDDLEFFTRLFLKAEKIIINKHANFYYRSGIKGLSDKKGIEANQSLFNAAMLSVNAVLTLHYHSPGIKQSCANILQGTVYELYPATKDLIAIAEKKISDLGGANLPYPAGGYTKYLAGAIGWKSAKAIKNTLKRVTG